PALYTLSLHDALPIFSTELSDYKCFAQCLLDTLTRALETSDSLTTQFRNELQKWKLSRVSIGAVSLDRQGPEFFLTSGTAILKQDRKSTRLNSSHDQI